MALPKHHPNKIGRRSALRTLGIGAAAVILPPSVRAQPPLQNAEPFIQIDKPRFTVGETVFFWVGVRGTEKGKATVIPRPYWDTCRLIITWPSGITSGQRIDWPMDGTVGSTWIGGAGLGGVPVPGRYTLVFEFARKQTAPATLEVGHLPLLEQIHANFVFGVPHSRQRHDTPVTLEVWNNSSETVRFFREADAGGIWVHLRGVSLPASHDFFYGKTAADETREPVVLKPGETYRRALSLTAAVDQARRLSPTPAIAPGSYSVTFGTRLELQIKNSGKTSGYSPLRLPVESTAICTIT